MADNSDRCLCLSRNTCMRVSRWSGYISAFVGVSGTFFLIIALVPIHHIEVNVEDSRLNTFALAITPNGSGESPPMTSFFAYNISVAVAVRNTNWMMSIRCTEPLMASIVFQDRRLYNVAVADEGDNYSARKTKLQHLQVARDVPSYILGTEAVEEFKKQNATGVFDVEVLFSGEIKYMGVASAFTRKRVKLGLTCPIRMQLAPPGAEVVVFREVNCKPDKRDKIDY